MSETLFEIPACESPRLKWLKKYDVHTHHNKDVRPGDEDEFSGEPIFPWVAFTGEPRFPRPDLGSGNTEEDAIVALAKFKGWKLWNEK